MATIRDVSMQAHVSIKTVSRVVNDSPDVSPATRERVLQVIHDLGYRPNRLARGLATGKTNTIGVVIPYSAQYVFAHYYFNEVLRGIGEVLDANNLDLLLHLGRSDEPYSELYYQHRADGLMLLAIAVDDPQNQDLIVSSVPAVYTCRVAHEHNPTSWVDSDVAPGIEAAVDHLAELGHTRIGYIGGPRNLGLARRQKEAVLGALRTRALHVRDSWIADGEYTFDTGHSVALGLMESEDRPTALVCGDDMIAIGAIRALESLSLSVPGDVSVVGFDDAVHAQHTNPALTTVHQDGHQKGYRAAELLMEILNEPVHNEPRHIELQTRLVVRDSTGPSPE